MPAIGDHAVRHRMLLRQLLSVAGIVGPGIGTAYAKGAAIARTMGERAQITLRQFAHLLWRSAVQMASLHFIVPGPIDQVLVRHKEGRRFVESRVSSIRIHIGSAQGGRVTDLPKRALSAVNAPQIRRATTGGNDHEPAAVGGDRGRGEIEMLINRGVIGPAPNFLGRSWIDIVREGNSYQGING